jgi:hypothetical protein
MTPQALNGYLAPEQIEKRKDESTRSAAVDCFGFGMTLYFIATGREPVFAEHRHAKWVSSVKQQVGDHRCNEWLSLPVRVARLIVNSTRDRQADRWDLTQIQGELARLIETLTGPSSVSSAELLAEEIMTRARLAEAYEWGESDLVASTVLFSGVQVRLEGDESNHLVKLHIFWHRRGEEDWRKVGKWIPDATKRAASALKTVGWSIQSENVDAQSVAFYCTASVLFAQKRLDELARGLSKASDALRFS